MLRTLTIFAAAGIAATAQQPPHNQSVPIYRVTVIEREVNAVNYQYRSGPTKVNFRGTVLMPDAGGEATVDSRGGRTEITAKFDDVTAPTRYGRAYLTYVLWAITPEGAPHNLGEVIPDASNDAKLHVTTGLQAFGMIVTTDAPRPLCLRSSGSGRGFQPARCIDARVRGDFAGVSGTERGRDRAHSGRR